MARPTGRDIRAASIDAATAAIKSSGVTGFSYGDLAERIGEDFDGRISGVTKVGLFVSLQQFGADGFIPVSTLGQTGSGPGRRGQRRSGTWLRSRRARRQARAWRASECDDLLAMWAPDIGSRVRDASLT